MDENKNSDEVHHASIDSPAAKPRRANPDRIVIDPETAAIVSSIGVQLAETFNGMVNLKTKEIVNFVLQKRSQLLDKSELRAVRIKYFDDVRAAQWALVKLQEAKGRGQDLTLAEVIEKMQFPQQSVQKEDARSGRALKKKFSTGDSDAVGKPKDKLENL